jgi:uncharacterized membrane protein YccC
MSQVVPSPEVSWSQCLRANASTAVFTLRAVLAMLLALLIAFRLDLSSPGSAAVTVSLISLPHAGMVLEKSFYRLAGTLTGALITAFQDAPHTFDIAVDRISIVSVGILSAGIVNAVLFPARSTAILVESIRTSVAAACISPCCIA